MPAKALITPLPAPACLPQGLRIYAIGDVHGCDLALAALHDLVSADLVARPVTRALLLHLGDYVDRGPDSAGVLGRLARPLPGLETLNLRGNHDQMMLDALAPGATEAQVSLWLLNGGVATLESYGAAPRDRASWQRIPDADLELLRGCPTCFEAGGYVFAHAGIRPGTPIATQDPADLMWIREPFLSWRGSLPAVVVHGHTPAAAPEVRPHRIGLDTGAVFGGPLTCGVLEADRIVFLQV
ncbi:MULTISPECIES: metallophosphoesterase family protein [Roseomonadaceae]|uniref:Serine/threonine protein phosphatase n=1 Tax=Falsiroseomonas oleicola TaxID=2801474 RepID=A0ABS6H479_9PROT|nr:metallophosphoesterase family protein [Roseomonas oleicola]MBU8542215.1 serine/threonine protein phosphatase [Roseomonas oleicola]